MELIQGQILASEVIARIQPFCHKAEVAGSIRRRRPQVNDIDILCIPKVPLRNIIPDIADPGTLGLDGPKLARFQYKGVQVDLYYATEGTWATLLLIRTGSIQSNIRLTSAAKSRGWKLKANGDGLLNERGRRVAGDTEQSIFEVLGLPYLEPEERE